MNSLIWLSKLILLIFFANSEGLWTDFNGAKRHELKPVSQDELLDIFGMLEERNFKENEANRIFKLDNNLEKQLKDITEKSKRPDMREKQRNYKSFDESLRSVNGRESVLDSDSSVKNAVGVDDNKRNLLDALSRYIDVGGVTVPVVESSNLHEVENTPENNPSVIMPWDLLLKWSYNIHKRQTQK
ncbi:unnamed protein product [Mytilus coruscus]|uniref:Uncharacterized protein n=1 Tax=Mytilus coruscus TaxID=42192 RepID=A0A6J8D5Z9_MYTCO|nr:unnamed protein product [Mytilus coruscus]